MFWFWFTIIIIFLFWFFYNPQPYQTIMIIGKKGSGKTCDIAKRSLKAQKKGIKVYSSIEIPGNYLFNPLDLKDCTFEPGSLVLIDEVGLIWDNRDFKSFEKGVNTWFKYSRQYKIKVYLYSQAFDIDLKIRNLCDKLILMTRIGKITLLRPINKKLGISTDMNGNGNLVDTYSFSWVFDWKFNYMPRYYGLFKSFNPPNREIVRSTFEQYDEINEVYKNIKTYILFKIKVFFNKRKNDIKRFYKNIISKNLERNEI